MPSPSPSGGNSGDYFQPPTVSIPLSRRPIGGLSSTTASHDLASLDDFDFMMSPAGTPMSSSMALQMSPTASQLVHIADQFRDGAIGDRERAQLKNAVLSQLAPR
jgi:hypothetical protein